MYNIDIYSYWKNPFSKIKKYTIHPLDDPGREKYHSKESHNFHYLKRTDPFIFKSITGLDYDTLVRQQKQDLDTLKKIEDEKKPIEQNTINNNINSNQENPTQPEKTNFINYNEETKNNIENNQINNNQCNNKNNIYENNNNNNNNIMYNTLNAHRSSSMGNLLPYRKERDFKSIYGYDNTTSFKSNGEKYKHAIESMKKTGFIGSTYPKIKKRYDGFTVSDCPVIHRAKSFSSLFKCYNDKMGHTLNCIENSKGERSAMNEEQMRNNLFNQTSKEFLKNYHLPDIIKIADSRQVIRNQRIGLSKEMGEKYNPYSFIAPSKNRTGRNYIGDLFKH